MENKPKFLPNPKLKLMEQVREVLRYHHYAYRTEQTYTQWILRFIHFQIPNPGTHYCFPAGRPGEPGRAS